MSLEIRKAQTSDAALILDYLNRVGGESDNLLFGAGEFTLTVEQEEKMIEQLNGSKASVMLLGLMDGDIVSIGSVQGSERPRIAHHGEIALSVSKSYWGQGVGTQMMEALIQFGKTAGLELLHLGVRADNLGGVRLYEKVGFRTFGTFPKFFKINGEFFDKMLMALEL